MVIENITQVGSIHCGEPSDKGAKELSGVMKLFFIAWIMEFGYAYVYICQKLSNCMLTICTFYKLQIIHHFF